MCGDILKAMDTEPEKEVLAEQLAALAKCIESLGNGCLTEEIMAELVKILDRLLKDHFQRFSDRQVLKRNYKFECLIFTGQIFLGKTQR